MTRFKVYNSEYDVTYTWDHDLRRSVERRVGPWDLPRPDEKWIVEDIDGGREFGYASHEEAIASIYEGST